MTTQDMIDEATENGACLVSVGASHWVKVTDDGNWYSVGNGEQSITREEALALMDRAKGIEA